MEDGNWETDKTPYLIFPCGKCHQFIYVKTSQKTKKCLRCGYTHTVKNILNTGEIINGMTDAVKLVKFKQNELAVKELGHHPDFKTTSDFKVGNYQEKVSHSTKNSEDKNILEEKFEKMLIKIASSYKNFPFYILEIMGNEYDIPKSELKLLIKNFQIKGYLTKYNDSTYSINLDC